MRYFPEEVETDLLDKGMDIHDWWNRTRRDDGTLKLSSRRLLSILNLLPDDSAFKSHVSEEWPRDVLVKVGILNELRIMRAENAVFNGNDYREPQLIKSPGQQKAEESKTEHFANIRTGIMAQLKREITS